MAAKYFVGDVESEDPIDQWIVPIADQDPISFRHISSTTLSVETPHADYYLTLAEAKNLVRALEDCIKVFQDKKGAKK